MKGLLIIDMQQGMFESERAPRNVGRVVKCINELSQRFRELHWPVILIQQTSLEADGFSEGESGWPFLKEIEQSPKDCIVPKTTCDSFYQTELEATLGRLNVDELYVTGWATDFCVDTTIRAAASREYGITVVADAHTAADRPHLDAAAVIEHHHWVWKELMVPRPIAIRPTDQLIEQLAKLKAV